MILLARSGDVDADEMDVKLVLLMLLADRLDVDMAATFVLLLLQLTLW